MLDISQLKVGDKVCYQPAHFDKKEWENGMVKEIPSHTTSEVRVVYKCAGNWKDFMNYTSALTSINDLTLGWKH